MQNSLQQDCSNTLSSVSNVQRQPLSMMPISNNYQQTFCENESKISTIRKKIRNLKLQIIAKQKHKMSDIDAFYWDNSLNRRVRMLQTFKLINVAKQQQITSPDKVTIQQLNDIDFPILSYTGQALCQFSMKLLDHCQFIPDNLSLQKTKSLVDLIALKYNIVSYHNFSHAFSLTLMFNQCFQRDQKFKAILTKEEHFYAIIAGLAHDISHPGTNNNFQIKMKSPLASKYQNQSVLQNMHINTLWDLIREHPQLNPFQNKQSKWKAFVARLILATDIAQHFKNLNNLVQKTKEGLNFQEQEEKYMVLQQVFHACDIGNPCLSFEGYMNWAALVSHEFEQQFKLQKSYTENFPQPTTILQFKGINNFYRGQKGFSTALVLPLWTQIAEVFPGLTFAKENIKKNLQILDNKIEQTKE